MLAIIDYGMGNLRSAQKALSRFPRFCPFKHSLRRLRFKESMCKGQSLYALTIIPMNTRVVKRFFGLCRMVY